MVDVRFNTFKGVRKYLDNVSKTTFPKLGQCFRTIVYTLYPERENITNKELNELSNYASENRHNLIVIRVY